ncbi:hypothetical protein [Citrobacter werkmanii]|uniref:hypothetical protein n=1 Tax=Citrobacter werkmanii TaxID=67827 RepID=UPI001575CE1D|nr:hypothetical protein [Citrobacter werkmanii]NTY83999.1 hypothetical protein [Citrobacter werkmanii]HCJ7431307.1 hypothetical protein [Citrobacter freundii]HCS9547018.1 hypothetical protein [Salmonella enterica subsp. diarizonae serovar 61:r:z53]
MLEKYYAYNGEYSEKEWKRLVAVQAALEVAKASAVAPTACVRSDKVENDLEYAAKKIAVLADAIQSALEKE